MRVLLADDHPLVLVGIRRVLEESEGFEVVGEAHSSREVLTLVRRTDPDLVLLDLRIPAAGGLRCLEWIRAHYREVRVVMLSVSTAQDMIEGAFARGASGYIAKSIDPADLTYALRVLTEAKAPLAVPFGIGDDAADVASSSLTERELTILRDVARGLPNKAIAREHWVSVQTVKFHLTNAYRKLGVSNRTEAARWVYEHGLASGTAPTAIGSRQ